MLDEAELEEAAAAKQAAAERAAAAAAGPTRVVHLSRPPEIEEVRRQLPIIGLEQEIMEGINHNDVVVSVRECWLCFLALPTPPMCGHVLPDDCQWATQH